MKRVVSFLDPGIGLPMFIFVATVAFFAPGLVGGDVPAARDLLVLVLPFRAFAATCIADGVVPTWIPHLFFGAPFLANYQSAVFYPPSAIFYVLGLPSGLSALLAFHVAVAGWGMARYLRRCEGLPATAALFGGLVFAFGGFLISLIPLTNHLQVVAWLPWLLEATIRLQREPAPGRFAAVVLLLVLQSLGGAPESLLLGLVVALVCAVRTNLAGGRSLRRSLLVPAAAVLAFGLTSFQLLPTLAYVLSTDRSGGLSLAEVSRESLEIRSFLQFLLPRRFVDGAPEFLPVSRVPLVWSLYVGILPLTAAALAVGRRGALLWFVLLLSGTLLAMGDHTPLFAALYGTAPGLAGVFRFPVKFFLLAHLALAVLAASGLAGILESPGRRRGALLLAGTLVVAGAALSWLAWNEPRQLVERLFAYDFPPDTSPGTFGFLASALASKALRLAGFSALLGSLILLLQHRRLRPTPFAACIIAATVVDLFVIHLPTLVQTDWQRLRTSVKSEALGISGGERIFHYCIEAPRCLPPGAPGLGSWSGRLRPGENAAAQAMAQWKLLVPNVPVVHGIDAVAGSDGLRTRDQVAFYRALAGLPRRAAIRLLAALGVEHLIGTERLDPAVRPEGSSERAIDPGGWIYTIPAAPRTYLARRVLNAEDVDGALRILAASDFRPGIDAVVVTEQDEAASTTTPGTLSDVRFSTRQVRARLDLPEAGLWVVTGTWFSGWRATIDGTAAPVIRVNGFQRGVRVPSGEHVVTMRYEERGLGAGLAVAGLTAVLLVAASLVWARRSRKC